jgi:hypothetical protein
LAPEHLVFLVNEGQYQELSMLQSSFCAETEDVQKMNAAAMMKHRLQRGKPISARQVTQQQLSK